MLDNRDVIVLIGNPCCNHIFESREAIQQWRPIPHHARNVAERSREWLLGMIRQINNVQFVDTSGGQCERGIRVAGFTENNRMHGESAREIFQKRRRAQWAAPDGRIRGLRR